MTIKEMLEQRAKHIADARAIKERADTEKRDMSAEDLGQFNTLLDQADKIDKDVKAREAVEARDRRLADAEASLRDSRGRRTEPNEPGNTSPGRGAGNEPREFRYRQRQSGVERILTLAGARAGDEYRASFRRWLGGSQLSGQELRALQADVDTEGGFLGAPQQMVAELIKSVDDAVPFRQFATVHTLAKAQNLGSPTLDTDVDDAAWTSELATGSEDTALRFGKRELNPSPLAKRIKISRKLIRTSVLDIEALVRERFAYKFGTTQEAAFMTGTGANQPLGVFTAHADGIPTSRDVSTSNTTTAITGDNLIEVKYSLKSAYLAKARWLFHRTAMKNIALLKDGEGQYLWRQGLVGGEPDTILGLPVTPSEWAPSTFTTGLYVGLLGDFSKYWIAESMNMEMQRLDELYAETNQVGFIARAELDGMPVLAEAFTRVKLA